MPNRNHYLTHCDAVADFVTYLASVITGEISVGEFWPGFDRRFGVERPGPEWRLEDLWRSYTWNGTTLAETTAGLRPLRRALRSALLNDVPAQRLTDLFRRVFDWGMDAHSAQRNHDWALKQGNGIVALYREASAELASDNPDLSVFDRARMNSGYTKVYAIPSANGVIYDSRVAAGLCWLISRYLVTRGAPFRVEVPEGLRLAIPAGKGDSPRSPSGNGLTFPVPGSSRLWAWSSVRANWLLVAALEEADKPRWCRGRYALRRIESALFMLGYRIDPDNRGATRKPTGERSSRTVDKARILATPLPDSFGDVYDLLQRQPNATVSLTTDRGTPFTATAKVASDKSLKIGFTHSYSVSREYWGANRNHYGQYIGQYVRPLAAWAVTRAA